MSDSMPGLLKGWPLAEAPVPPAEKHGLVDRLDRGQYAMARVGGIQKPLTVQAVCVRKYICTAVLVTMTNNDNMADTGDGHLRQDR